MRVIQRTISILALALVCAGIAFPFTAKAVQARMLIQSEPEITAVIPHNPPPNPKAVDISYFAWRDFVALNWPADCQGKPLDKKIGEAPDAPRVWEFYRTPDKVFLPDGQDPNTIQPKKPLSCPGDERGLKVRITEAGKLAKEDEFDKVKTANSDSLLDGKGELMVALEEVKTTNNFPLVDQQGNYVINEIHINQDEFEQIVNEKLYDSRNLEQFDDDKNRLELFCSKNENNDQPEFPCSNTRQDGAIEIKAAWRVFDAKFEDEKARLEKEKFRYYTTKRRLLIPAEISVTGEAFSQEVEVGLIGFHIVHKTSEQGWIWSTFEQVDNVPDTTQAQGRYTLYNPDCDEKNCPPNQKPSPPYFWLQDAPHAVTKVGDKIRAQIPSQIVREAKEMAATFDDETLEQLKEQTQHWQNKLQAGSKSSVWQYYKLIGTEWLGNFETPYMQNIRVITPVKPPLANVALEPYSQGVSCINCHTSASLPNKACADFSFLMDKKPSFNCGLKAQ